MLSIFFSDLYIIHIDINNKLIINNSLRFDILANQYYGDQSLWWIISIANTAVAGTDLPSDLSQDSLIIPEGTQIRIPSNYANVLNIYKQLNGY